MSTRQSTEPITVPSVLVKNHADGTAAVFVRWSGESVPTGSRVTEWMRPAGAEQLARVLRGIVTDAYLAGQEGA